MQRTSYSRIHAEFSIYDRTYDDVDCDERTNSFMISHDIIILTRLSSTEKTKNRSKSSSYLERDDVDCDERTNVPTFTIPYMM